MENKTPKIKKEIVSSFRFSDQKVSPEETKLMRAKYICKLIEWRTKQIKKDYGNRTLKSLYFKGFFNVLYFSHKK